MRQLERNLIKEFSGQDSTLIYKVRKQFLWDHDHFVELANMMVDYCHIYKKESEFNLKINKGMWEISHLVNNFMLNDNFIKKNEFDISYYLEIQELIYLISSWYFNHESPLIGHLHFKLKINKIGK